MPALIFASASVSVRAQRADTLARASCSRSVLINRLIGRLRCRESGGSESPEGESPETMFLVIPVCFLSLSLFLPLFSRFLPLPL